MPPAGVGTLPCCGCLSPDVAHKGLDMLYGTTGPTVKEAFFDCIQTPATAFMPHLCSDCFTALGAHNKFKRDAAFVYSALLKKYNAVSTVQATEGTVAAVVHPLRYRCKICNVMVDSQQLLKQHVEQHLDYINYVCQLCSFKAANRDKLEAHYATAHKERATRNQLKPKITCITEVQQNNNEPEDNASDALIVQDENTDTSSDYDSAAEFTDGEDSVETNDSTLDDPTSVNVEQPPTVASSLDSDEIIACRECRAFFASVEMLKIHMLDHHTLKPIYCDICTFFTFFAAHLAHHYKEQHQTMPRFCLLRSNETPETEQDSTDQIYSCHLCRFGTKQKSLLRQHYTTVHPRTNAKAPLRPSMDSSLEEDRNVMYKAQNIVANPAKRQRIQSNSSSDWECKSCDCVFSTREQLNDHYTKEHTSVAKLNKTDKEPVKIISVELLPNVFSGENNETSSDNTIAINTDPNTGDDMEEQEIVEAPQADNVDENFVEQPQFDFVDMENLNLDNLDVMRLHWNDDDSAEMLPMAVEMVKSPPPSRVIVIPKTNAHPLQGISGSHGTTTAVAVVAPHPKVNMAANWNFGIGDMPAMPLPMLQEGMPLDAVPQLVEMDSIIQNDFEDDQFMGDVLFDPIEEDNTNNDNYRIDELVLVSDSDVAEQEVQNATDEASNPQTYCPYSNVHFDDQYQFESHSDLASYHCQMCTNLYNNKQSLVCHYHRVHQVLPTPDMLQPKADKVNSVDQMTMDQEAVEQMTVGQVALDEMAVEQMGMDQAIMDLPTMDQATIDQMAADQIAELELEAQQVMLCDACSTATQCLQFHLDFDHGDCKLSLPLP